MRPTSIKKVFAPIFIIRFPTVQWFWSPPPTLPLWLSPRSLSAPDCLHAHDRSAVGSCFAARLQGEEEEEVKRWASVRLGSDHCLSVIQSKGKKTKNKTQYIFNLHFSQVWKQEKMWTTETRRWLFKILLLSGFAQDVKHPATTLNRVTGSHVVVDQWIFNVDYFRPKQ